MIEALMSPVTTSKMVEYQAGLRNRISIVWVPVHSEVEGNEKADELDWLTSAGVRPWTANSEASIAMCKSAEGMGEGWAYRALGSVRGRNTHEMLPPETGWKMALRTDQHGPQSHLLVVVITVLQYLKKMGLSNTSECTCELWEETGIQVICDYTKFLQTRRSLLGNSPL